MANDWVNLRSLFWENKNNYFPNIGKSTVDKILDAVSGSELLEILQTHNKQALKAIPCINESRALTLLHGYARYKPLINVASYLDENGFVRPIAIKAYAVWGPTCLEMVRKNPYRLLALSNWDDVDRLGLKRGPEFHPCRVVAAIQFCMYIDYEEEKNTCITTDFLFHKVFNFIGCNRSIFNEGIRLALNTGAIVEYKDNLQVPAVYLFERKMENFLAANHSTGLSPTKARAFVENDRNKMLTPEQGTAVVNAITNRFSAFSGRGGRGKTFTLTAIADAAETLLRKKIILSAVSAKACRKIEKETGRPAWTIATLLHVKEQQDLANSHILIDEASMLSLADAYHIFRKLPVSSNLVLLGDPYQIPSIDAGRFFSDIVHKKVIPHVQLTINKRQDEKTDRQLNLIIDGKFPKFETYENGVSTGLYCSVAKSAEVAEKLAIDLYLKLISYCEEVQIISPLRQHLGGSESINKKVHQAIHRTPDFCIGTPVVWTKNLRVNWGTRLTNGSMGIVRGFGSKGFHLCVEFEYEGIVMLSKEETSNFLEKSYCLTVHKSQGSDWDNVIIVLPKNERMVDRNMVYTALSRCRQRAIVIYENHDFVARQVALPPAHLRRRSLFLSGVMI